MDTRNKFIPHRKITIQIFQRNEIHHVCVKLKHKCHPKRRNEISRGTISRQCIQHIIQYLSNQRFETMLYKTLTINLSTEMHYRDAD